MRVLICHNCRSMESIPDYTGPLERAEVPGPDGNLVEQEVPPVGADIHLDHISEPHRRGEHVGTLLHIPDEQWNNREVREGVIAQIRETLTKGVTGLTPEAYAMRDTFTEGALACFKKHGRPSGGCIDWHDRSKKLGNSLLTSEERKIARGLPQPKKRYLCDFCPVASWVEKQQFDKSQLYN